MNKLKIINVASARPNFMKVAPLLKEYKNYDGKIESKLLHTGQHYDYEMSKIFFKELGIPTPDLYLGIGSGSHAQQTAKVMIEFEKVLEKEQPDWVIVVGDVNPTMACTVVASKMDIKVAHIEAGLRSYDKRMPEEINRILTDSISDLLLTPSIGGNMNLIKEGISEEKIHFVGNIMIDTLYQMRKRSQDSNILRELALEVENYMLMTLHRPSNVDKPQSLARYVEIIRKISRDLHVVWPVHPRTRKNAKDFGLWDQLKSNERLHLLKPIGYIDNICLMNNARFVLTDSGGIQEETTALGVPCITVRENTERPITIEEGTNILAGTEKKNILDFIEKILQDDHLNSDEMPKPLYWDGKTAQRIVRILLEYQSQELN